MKNRQKPISHYGRTKEEQKCYNWDSVKDFIDDDSKENHEYVFFAGCHKKSWQTLPDIDLMDLPISGSWVSLAGAVSMPQQQVGRLPVQFFKGSKLVMSKCAFCQQKINAGDQIVELPCKHALHLACLKKWTFIPNPCRKCNNK